MIFSILSFNEKHKSTPLEIDKECLDLDLVIAIIFPRLSKLGLIIDLEYPGRKHTQSFRKILLFFKRP